MLIVAAVLAGILVTVGFIALKARSGLTRLEDHIVASAKRNPRRRRMMPQAALSSGRGRRKL